MTSAILSLIPILSGIFLIFPWVIVDQLFVKLRETKIVIQMHTPDNPITRSLSSLSIQHKPYHHHHHSRPVSRTNTVRSNRSVKSVRDVKKRSDLRHRTHQLHFRSQSHLSHVLITYHLLSCSADTINQSSYYC